MDKPNRRVYDSYVQQYTQLREFIWHRVYNSVAYKHNYNFSDKMSANYTRTMVWKRIFQDTKDLLRFYINLQYHLFLIFYITFITNIKDAKILKISKLNIWLKTNDGT